MEYRHTIEFRTSRLLKWQNDDTLYNIEIQKNTRMPYNTVIIDAPAIVQKAGVQPGMNVADLGTGREGRMALAAGKVMANNGTSYAVDVVKSILPAIATKARMHGINNVVTVWSDLEIYGATRAIVDNSLDVGFVVTTLFQSNKQAELLAECIRMVKPGGKLVVVDWRPDSEAPFGPDPSARVHADSVKRVCEDAGLQLTEEFDAGPYHWGLLFTK